MSEVEYSRFRQLHGPVSHVWHGALLCLPVIAILFIIGVHQYLRISFYKEQYIGVFLALVLFAIFVGVPAKKSSFGHVVPWYDWLLSILGLVVGLYIAFYYPQLTLDFGNITPERFVLSVIAVILIVESLRRLVGWALVIIIGVFLAYAYVAPFMPGPMRGASTSTAQLFNYLYLDSNSLLSLLWIASSVAIAFILFGQILIEFKGGDILNNFVLSIFGRTRGGPAKAAVVGSSLVGSITGGPVANVMITGTVTIPMMIKNGYPREYAGAVEAVSSTGGQIMPPVMGIAAFVMAEYLGIPYAEVALAALVPALLYYICVFAQVDINAARRKLKLLPADQLPLFGAALRDGWVIIPAFGALIYTLFVMGLSPQSAGVYSSGLAALFLAIRKEGRLHFFKQCLQTLIDTGKTMLEVTVILSAAGLVIGIVSITGLGFNMVMSLAQIGQFGLFYLLLACAVVCIILGMGMPSVAAYTLVAVLIAPALVDLGVVPIAAHMFVFYFAIISNFTPPVALACFAAAPIAKANPHKIGFVAMRLGVVSYIVPFMFVYSPSILLTTQNTYSPLVVVSSIVTAVIACIILSVSVEGYLFQVIGTVKRVIFVILSLILFVPVDAFAWSWLMNVLAALIMSAFFIYEKFNVRSEHKELETSLGS